MNLDTISQLKELLGDKFASLIDTYTSNGAKYIAAMQEGLADGEVQKVVDAAHPLKSSSGNLGADSLSGLCADIEQKGKVIIEGDGDVSGLSDLIAQAAVEFDASKAFLAGHT